MTILFYCFLSHQENAIKLMHQLRQSKAPLSLYEGIMQWHKESIENTPSLTAFASSITPQMHITRESLFKKLFNRYNMTDPQLNRSSHIFLPHSQSSVEIITNDLGWCMQSLLTDPSICDEDYLFHNNDPFSFPPQERSLVGDINTSRAYYHSYRDYIEKVHGGNKRILLPVIFYIDATQTAAFSDLPITAVKFTLGIFNRKARDRPELWRILGYVPNHSAEQSEGRRQFVHSGHVESATNVADSTNMVREQQDDDGTIPTNKNGVAVKPQDFHTILSSILEPYLNMQEEDGFLWDLSYGGKLHENVHFVPYVHMLKCDTEEADLLAGKYLSRNKNVKQLCRCCVCPTSESDNPHAIHARKTQTMIKQLIDDRNMQALSDLSQHCIRNAWYPIRFGAHSKADVVEGIHGSCPFEMLHHLLLGIFKYVRDSFFEQIGTSNPTAKSIIALASKYGDLFSRQSDRDMPITKFPCGIHQKGMMTGKKYSGLLLVMATVLRSSQGSELIIDSTDEICNTTVHDRESREEWIDDWLILLETLLMWEMWLKSEQISTHHITRAQQKHRFIMYLIRQVANRRAGMRFKIVKFHAIVHMADDILRFGVPMNFDTGSDESGHKVTKTAAVHTQKRREIFDEQVGRRISEVHALRLAFEEIDHGRSIWNYHRESRRKTVTTTTPDPNGPLSGSKFKVVQRPDGNKTLRKIGRALNGMADVRIDKYFVKFLAELEVTVRNYGVSNLVVYSEIKRNNVLYRGTPSFDGAAWRDWVMVDWDEEGILPNKIWGFVDLSQLPAENDLNLGGLAHVEPGIYAVVESASKKPAKEGVSSLFLPFLLQVGAMSGNMVSKRKFYLAPLWAFSEPAVVLPDIGGANNRYLLLKRRDAWRDEFKSWLDADHEWFPSYEEIEEESDSSFEADEEDSSEEEDEDLEEEDSSEEYSELEVETNSVEDDGEDSSEEGDDE